jgi:hypothetical protein
VCESNAPLTSEMPIAGFEDRESHRTPFASARSPSVTNRLQRATNNSIGNCDYTLGWGTIRKYGRGAFHACG